MSTNFPTSLDTFYDPAGTDSLNTGGGIGHAAVHANANDAIAALEAKVGANGSAVTSSLDYKISHIASGGDTVFGNGVSTCARGLVVSTYSPSAGQLVLTGFVPAISFTSGHVALRTSSTLSTTAFYMGLYTIASNGNGTLVASTADSHTIVNAGANNYTLAWSSPYAVVAGAPMAVAMLPVGAAASSISAPTATGITGAIANLNIQPFYAYLLGSQSTLPASITFNAGNTSTTAFYAEITT